jgi:hypothetical protein
MSNTSFQIPDSLATVSPDDIIRDCLTPAGFKSVANITTGLRTKKVAPGGPTIDQIVEYLRSVDFGGQEINNWDCADRAIWGIVHARHRFPGCAVGMAEGNASVGTICNADHAVMIIWDRDFKYRYYDPLLPENEVTFHPAPIRIIALPLAIEGESDTVEPFTKLHLPRLQSGSYVRWDTQYKIYPTKTNERNGVVDYLWNAVYEKNCVSLNAHTSKGDLSYWKATDAAFWSYSHVRRIFPGCAIGVAFGKPADDTKSTVVNIIFSKDGKKIKPIFWDSLPQNKMEVSFTPNRIFF